MDVLLEPLNSFSQQFMKLWGDAIKALFGSSVSTAADGYTVVLDGGLLQGLPLWLAVAIMVGLSIPVFVAYYIVFPALGVGTFASVFAGMLFSVQRTGRAFTRQTLRIFGSGFRAIVFIAAFILSVAALIGFLMYLLMLILNILALHQVGAQVVLFVSEAAGLVVFGLISAGFVQVYQKYLKPEPSENEREMSHLE